MAKTSCEKPPGLDLPCVEDVYSVSGCVNDDFADYIDCWKHSLQMRHAPECSPLSCNGVAEDVVVNEHCLMRTFEEAKVALEEGKFSGAEPGPYRIFAVYSVNWPVELENDVVGH